MAPTMSRSRSRRKHFVLLSVTAPLLLATAACGLLIGLGDHEAYPAEGGVGEGGNADATNDGPGGESGHEAGDAGGDAHGDAADCGAVNLQNDPNNCGACGHSCGASPCYEGTCGGNAVVALAAGASHDCALLQVGEVWCWGADDKAQVLGPSSDAGAATACPDAPCRTRAQRIPGVAHAVAISAGGDQTCALDGDGGVWCWGANPSGGLGHAPGGDPFCTTADASVPCNAQPSLVGGLPGAASAIATGQTGFACALVGGSAYCWGDDRYAQLGPAGDGGPSPTPVLVTGGVSAVAAGYAHACVLAGQTASCWGSNQFGELGHDPDAGGSTCAGGTPCNPSPQSIAQTGVKAMHPGRFATCFDTTAGPACLGMNDTGQLGRNASNGTPNSAPASLAVVSASSLTSLDLAHKTGCGITGGQPHCWGDDETHQTTDPTPDTCGSTSCVLAGYAVALFDVVEVRTSPFVTLARNSTGQVFAWGYNGSGQLAHAPGSAGDVGSCDPALFDGGTVCNPKPVAVGGLP